MSLKKYPTAVGWLSVKICPPRLVESAAYSSGVRKSSQNLSASVNSAREIYDPFTVGVKPLLSKWLLTQRKNE